MGPQLVTLYRLILVLSVQKYAYSSVQLPFDPRASHSRTHSNPGMRGKWSSLLAELDFQYPVKVTFHILIMPGNWMVTVPSKGTAFCANKYVQKFFWLEIRGFKTFQNNFQSWDFLFNLQIKFVINLLSITNTCYSIITGERNSKQCKFSP